MPRHNSKLSTTETLLREVGKDWPKPIPLKSDSLKVTLQAEPIDLWERELWQRVGRLEADTWASSPKDNRPNRFRDALTGLTMLCTAALLLLSWRIQNIEPTSGTFEALNAKVRELQKLEQTESEWILWQSQQWTTVTTRQAVKNSRGLAASRTLEGYKTEPNWLSNPKESKRPKRRKGAHEASKASSKPDPKTFASCSVSSDPLCGL